MGDLAGQLFRHVDMLAGVIGERHVFRAGTLEASARYIEATLRQAGLATTRHVFQAGGQEVANIDAEMRGRKRPERIWIVGAHYDSVDGTPGADDNASAVAGVLEIARLLNAGGRFRDTVRFVLLVNEEPPFYKGPEMGSVVYARRCKERQEQVAGMINLEMIGFYSDAPGSQRYPIPLNGWLGRKILPDRGNFISFVGDRRSFWLTRRCRRLFRKSVKFPAQWIAGPGRIEGLGMSDHWSFWQEGYRAVMVTDTSFFRNENYHTNHDTPDTLDYERTATVVQGLAGMMRGLAGEL